MRMRWCLFGWAVLVFAASATGCSKEPASPATPAARAPEGSKAETVAREKFAEIQAAIKATDANKLWALLSSKSRAAAEKEAKVVRTDYQQGDAKARAALEKKLGLPGAELAKLMGPGYLRTKVFRDKREVADSTVTRVTARDDNVTVYFTEPDGDKEKLIFVREDGTWKAWMAIPEVRNARQP